MNDLATPCRGPEGFVRPFRPSSINMFTAATLSDLINGDVYRFSRAPSVYFMLAEFYDHYFRMAPVAEELERGSDERKSLMVWAAINEAWWVYGSVNPELPIRWLALAKKLLALQLMPSNVHVYCTAIVQSLDVDRYQKHFGLPDEELRAIKADLPEVLQGLKTYPAHALLPPIPEKDWEEWDEIPDLSVDRESGTGDLHRNGALSANAMDGEPKPSSPGLLSRLFGFIK
ncbi:hypothetical protein [Roseateles sp. MS654]|uniref:hypothetical protein n=1 Tax=Roseateles sp. MS654 TaxID=3412685 RepID=UPI003C2D3353